MISLHKRLAFLLALLVVSTSLPGAADAQPRQGQRRAEPAKPRGRNAQAAQGRGRPRAAARAPERGLGEIRAAARNQQQLRRALEKSGARFFERNVQGGTRIIANVTGKKQLDAVIEAVGSGGSDVLQLLHIGDQGIQHTMAIFDGRLVHFQYRTGTGNWRLRNWGDRLRPSDRKMYSAFISLTADEAASMRQHLDQAERDQGPEHAAGNNWENGKLKNTSLGGCRSFNCTSAWTQMPLGKDNKSLLEITGMPSTYAGSPRQIQKQLETQGNDRIIGVAVMGPEIRDFGANPDAPVTDL